MSIKIVHCADLHIGAPMSFLPKKDAVIRKEEVYSSLSQIISFCKEKAVDALLICGDLFDSPCPDEADCEFVRNALSSLYPIDVYISAGNHDYIGAGSPYSRQDYFSENVHIFPCFEYCFELPEKNAAIWGKSYNTTHITPSFETSKFDNDKINIFCLHGDTVCGSDYNIISHEFLSSVPCSYAAFGHIHSGELFKIQNVQCAYCGTPEGQSFGDTGFNGIIYAEVSKENTNLTKIPLAKRCHHNISFDASGMNTYKIAEKIKDFIKHQDLYRITLTGEYNNTDDLSIPVIKKELSGAAFYIDILDAMVQGYDFDEIEKEESLRGAFLRELRSEFSCEEDFLLSAKAGLDALSGRIPDIGGGLC